MPLDGDGERLLKQESVVFSEEMTGGRKEFFL
jgi:hypothetical protein